MKSDRFDYLVWTVMAVLIFAILGVYAVGTLQGVRVAAAYPEDGGEVGAFSKIGIRFAESMQASSVEARLEISPDTEGRYVWEDEMLWFFPAEPFKPQTEYTLRLEAGAESLQGREVRQDHQWHFRVREPSVLFLSDRDGETEIWRGYLDGRPPEPVTRSGSPLVDFAVSWDGERILYSAINDQGGIDLWAVNRDGSGERLFLDCGLDRCTSPAWSPDGARVAYSREQSGLTPQDPLTPPRIWILDAATGATTRLFASSQKLGYGPVWHSAGDRLALFDSGAGGIRVLEFSTREETILPSQLGMVGSWSPDGDSMLFIDIAAGSEQYVTRVYKADIDVQDISSVRGVLSDETYDYSIPAWSPDGEWMMVGVRSTVSVQGRQLWLMPLDARFAERITDEPEFVHYNYSWDPWGTAVVYQRIQTGTGGVKPEIMVWSRDTYESRRIAEDGTGPVWSP